MKGRKQATNNKKSSRIVKYSIFTVILTCAIVTGYYLVANGIIFGKYVPESPYIEQSYIDNPDSALTMTEDELTVTPKNSFTSLKTAPLLSGLPEVPDTDGTVQKGTADNPLVVLEVVPELAQQSLSYLVATPEEGLPFDALEMGREVSKSKNSSLVKNKGTGTINNIHVPSDNWDYNIEGTCLRSLGGWFDNNNNNYAIYNPDGTVIGADKTTGEDQRASAPWAYLSAYYTVELKRDVSFAGSISGGSTTESRKKISDLKSENTDFVDKAGTEIPGEAIQDDANWAWSYKRDDSADKEFTVKVTTDKSDFISAIEDYKNGNLTFTQLANSYADYFAKSAADTDISDEERARKECWSLQKEEKRTKGYIVYAGKGEGEFTFNGDSIWKESASWGQTTNDKNAWIYVETKPDNYSEIWEEGKYWYQVSNQVMNTTEKGSGFPASRISSNQIWGTDKTLPQENVYTFRYKYEGYIFKFEYVGMKLNDILKRMLFWYEDDKNSDGEIITTADEKYEDTYIKVIAVTPAMINQMDEGDTAATLDYIERADVFFFSSYYCDEDDSVDALDKLMQFYYDYVDPERTTNHKTYAAGQMASFYENDLEWVDCMKIIKRLSGDPSLPMMFSKQLGDMLNEGVKRDGTRTSHMYVNDTRTCQETAGSLSNIAKMYLICTQYNLSAKKDKPGKDQNGNEIEYLQTFMDDIYGNIKQVPVASAGTESGSVEHTAKYTGFYKRPVLAGCDADTKVKENAYYLWNVFTFIPVVPTSSPNSLFSGVELNVDNFLKYGFLESSIRNQQYMDSIKGSGGDAGKINGTTDPEKDYQNVMIAGNGQSANTNFVIFNNGVMGNVGKILYEIMNNGTPMVPTMDFSVLNTAQSRKYYQRLANDSVLIDYSQTATYKSNKTLYLHCNLDNAGNEETSILTKVTLTCSDETKGLSPITLTPQRIDGVALSKEDIDFSEEQTQFNKVKGYAVNKNDELKFAVPFTLEQWQQGYDTIRVEWVSRTSKRRGANYFAYQNPDDLNNAEKVKKAKQYAEVTIGERGLFTLQ